MRPAHSLVRPRCRGLHSLTKTAAGRLVLFAGAPKSGPMLGDLWALDPASGAWAELDPDGQARRSRPPFGMRPLRAALPVFVRHASSADSTPGLKMFGTRLLWTVAAAVALAGHAWRGQGRCWACRECAVVPCWPGCTTS